jgi:hypothetical protein
VSIDFICTGAVATKRINAPDVFPNLLVTTLAVVALGLPLSAGRADASAPAVKAPVQVDYLFRPLTLGINPNAAIQRLGESAPITKYAVQVDVYPNLQDTTLKPTPPSIPPGVPLDTSQLQLKYQVQLDQPMGSPLTLGIATLPIPLPLGLPVDVSQFMGKFEVTDSGTYTNILILGIPPAPPPAPPAAVGGHGDEDLNILKKNQKALQAKLLREFRAKRRREEQAKQLAESKVSLQARLVESKRASEAAFTRAQVIRDVVADLVREKLIAQANQQRIAERAAREQAEQAQREAKQIEEQLEREEKKAEQLRVAAAKQEEQEATEAFMVLIGHWDYLMGKKRDS